MKHANESMTHAQKLAFFRAASHPRHQTGGGLQVPVLQMGGGVTGLGRVSGSDHRVVGVLTPDMLEHLESVPQDRDESVPASSALATDPAQSNLTRQELVATRIARPEL